MRWKTIPFLVVAAFIAACSSTKTKPEPTLETKAEAPPAPPASKPGAKTESTAPADPLQLFQSRAAAFHSVVKLPVFETTTNQLRTTLANTITNGNAALDRIGNLDPARATFQNTV